MSETAVVDGVSPPLEKKVFKTKASRRRLFKVKEVPLSSIVIVTGARDYGPPRNVSERRM
jgi:hypothetical protein